MLLKADAHGLSLQRFELIAADAVHLGVGLAEEADRVVHEFGHRPRRLFRDCHSANDRPRMQSNATMQLAAILLCGLAGPPYELPQQGEVIADGAMTGDLAVGDGEDVD